MKRIGPAVAGLIGSMLLVLPASGEEPRYHDLNNRKVRQFAICAGLMIADRMVNGLPSGLGCEYVAPGCWLYWEGGDACPTVVFFGVQVDMPDVPPPRWMDGTLRHPRSGGGDSIP